MADLLQDEMSAGVVIQIGKLDQGLEVGSVPVKVAGDQGLFGRGRGQIADEMDAGTHPSGGGLIGDGRSAQGIDDRLDVVCGG